MQLSMKLRTRGSGHCGHSVGIPLIAANEGDLNENNRTGGGDRRKDVFAEALMPEIVHGQTQADKYKPPDVKTELDQHRNQADI